MSKYSIIPSEEGVSKEEAMEAFNQDFVKTANLSKDFNNLPEEVRSAIAGRVLGSVNTKLKKALKELDLDLIEGDTAGSIETLAEKLAEVKADYQKEIEDARKGNPDVESKLNALEKKLEDQKALNKKLKEDFELAKSEKENLAKEFTAKEKAILLNEYKRNQLSKLSLVEDEVYKLAFEKKLESFKVELDEENTPRVLDANGNPILSKKEAGKFADYAEVAFEVAESIKAIKKAPESGQFNTPLTPTNGGERKTPRKVG
jgi:chromosome segregation ATPase